MKNANKFLAIGLTIVLVAGCGARKEEQENQSFKAKTDTLSSDQNRIVSSIAAVLNKDSARKFIRTADLKFQVKDVRKATYAIEDAVIAFNGFVTYTNLTSHIDHRMITPASADSSHESTYFTVINDMIIRVPNTKLDTLLKSVAYLMDYLDFRIIKAEDVSLPLLSNKMAEKRLNTHEERLKNAIDNRGRKLNETENAEENLLNTQTATDNARLANLNIKDQIAFSTIRINIYQRQSIKKEIIETEKPLEPYQPGFITKVKQGIQFGWEILESILLFILNSWSLILLGLVMLYLYRKYLSARK